MHSQPKQVLVVGGSGRVGGSAVRSLLNFYQDRVNVHVGGRKLKNWESYKRDHRNIPALNSVEFQSVDIRNARQLDRIVPKFDLVVHTAGPFQGLEEPTLLNSCLKHGKSYIDVCDDVALSRICRSEAYQQKAKDSKATAVISTGIWPGGSSLLAKKVIHEMGGSENVKSVVFSFFTAGSGGAGSTLLSATFLILGEEVLTYVNGQPVYRKTATDARTVDFGNGIGKREIARLNLIECESCYRSGVNTVETFFGTSPPFWNTLFQLMATFVPSKVLKNRRAMDVFGKVSLPMVRFVDKFTGSKNGECGGNNNKLHLVDRKLNYTRIAIDTGIRVDVTDKAGRVRTGLLTHNDMEQAVGDAVRSFAGQLLFQGVDSGKPPLPHGVFFPEEVDVSSFVDNVLSDIAEDALEYSLDFKQ